MKVLLWTLSITLAVVVLSFGIMLILKANSGLTNEDVAGAVKETATGAKYFIIILIAVAIFGAGGIYSLIAFSKIAKANTDTIQVVSNGHSKVAEAYNQMPGKITIRNDSDAKANAGLLQQKNPLQRTQNDDPLQQQLLQLQKENLQLQQDLQDDGYNVLGDEKTESKSVIDKFIERRQKKDEKK